MSCTCNKSLECEPCAFCTPPGVKCLPDCNPPDPCSEKIDLCCVNFSGESQECANIENEESLCDLIQTFYEALNNPDIFCQVIFTVTLIDDSPKTILLTLNNTGGDQGPFEIFTIDDQGNETLIPGIFTYDQLTESTTFEVESNIVSIKVRSIRSVCSDYYDTVDIPVPQYPHHYDARIAQEDLDDATGNTVYPNNEVVIEYIDFLLPEAGPQYRSFSIAGTFASPFCSFQMPTLFYYKNDVKVTLILSEIVGIGDCPYYS